MTDIKPPVIEQKINYWGQDKMLKLMQKQLKQKAQKNKKKK